MGDSCGPGSQGLSGGSLVRSSAPGPRRLHGRPWGSERACSSMLLLSWCSARQGPALPRVPEHGVP